MGRASQKTAVQTCSSRSPRREGTTSRSAGRLRLRNLPRPKYVLIACQPKTGSTFLTTSIGTLPRAKVVSLVPGYDRREQELCESRIGRLKHRLYRLLVAQHHVRCSEPTKELVAKHDMAVVVLRRNLYDAVVSLRDHVRMESIVFPMMYFLPQHTDLADEDLEQIIAQLAIPWYLNFHISWREFPGAFSLDYMAIAKSPVDTMMAICDFAGRPCTVEEARTASASSLGTRTRLNVGVSGRGEELSDRTKDIIRSQVSAYARISSDPYLESHL